MAEKVTKAKAVKTPKAKKIIEPAPVPFDPSTSRPLQSAPSFSDFDSSYQVIDKPSEKLELYQNLTQENYSKEDIEVKTELNQQQILVFARGKEFAKKYKTPLIDNLMENIMILSVSKNRQSRKEQKEIAQSMLGSQAELERGSTLREKLFGK